MDPARRDDDALQRAIDLLRGRRVVALTGAGCSTRSGIPDYRGPTTRERARTPVQLADFTGMPEARRRYWARAAVGWPRFRAAQPNAAHHALARLEHAGVLHGLITQNVDGLHHAAGSEQVVELHGALSSVRCLACGATEPRDDLQARLLALNPELAGVTPTLAPDGDAELPAQYVERFVVAGCRACEGPLKPAVVFFGEAVPPEVTARAWELWGRAEVLLSLGSSLAVFSGYRFVRRAAKEGLPVVNINLGPTRGDAESTVRLDADVVDALPALAAALAP